MPYRRTTLSKFIIDEQRRSASQPAELTSLLNDVQTACKLIGVAVSRGELKSPGETETATLDAITRKIMVSTCEWGGQLAAMIAGGMDAPYRIPSPYPRGNYLLAFDALEGGSNIDVNVAVGTIFSVLRCDPGITDPSATDFLQPGTAQVAAGYAIYGPMSMLVLTLGDGVHGFTLDPEIGAFELTHPNMHIPPTTREFAVDISHERFWEPPVRRYVEECLDGEGGPRGAAFTLRWTASTVAEVHRILMRGGLFMSPGVSENPERQGRLRLLYQANPLAMIVEQAGGAASTGRGRLLDERPQAIHQRVPAILGSREEVERLERYHDENARGIEPSFRTPLFNVRSLFRDA